jgi:ABC-2 type transport system permease protein
MNRVLAVARKETYHIMRDRRSLIVAILMPMMMVLIYGYAIDMEMKNLKVGILDYDHSLASRDLVTSLTSGGFIVDAARLWSREEVEVGFRRGRFRAVLVIPRGYAKSLAQGAMTDVQLLIDGADGTTAATVDNYMAAVLAKVNSELSAARAGTSLVPLDVRSRILFNPELVSANFIVPGLVAVVLMMICALLTSIAITREKETGTLEQVLTTPITPGQLIIGKVLPYMVIAALDSALVLLVGRFVFGVPMHGSWWALAGYSLIYLLIALALGLLISALAKTQQVAMMAALTVTFLPTLLLSGFVFAHSSMPLPLRLIGRIVPATYYLRVIREIMMKGKAWFPQEGAVMAGMAILLMAMAVKRFQSRLE